MPDKKLTDSEIVKALKNYIKDIGCAKCGFKDKYLLVIIKSALDLINRLQAENERVKPFEEKIAEFNSHIRVEDMLVFASSLEEWLEFCENLKAEAYKEFAELMKRDSHYVTADKEELKWLINQTLKELVGEESKEISCNGCELYEDVVGDNIEKP